MFSVNQSAIIYIYITYLVCSGYSNLKQFHLLLSFIAHPFYLLTSVLSNHSCQNATRQKEFSFLWFVLLTVMQYNWQCLNSCHSNMYRDVYDCMHYSKQAYFSALNYANSILFWNRGKFKWTSVKREWKVVNLCGDIP